MEKRTRSNVDEDYAKILIVSHNALSHHSNNGKTIYSLFKNWPAENIAQLYFQDEEPESERFYNFFRIRDTDILKVMLGMKKMSHCGDVAFPEKSLGNQQMNRSRIKEIFKCFLSNHMYLHTIGRDLIYGTNLWQSKKFLNWIDLFCPEGIFFHGGNSLFPFKVVLWLSEKYKIPLYVYLTDDYVINNIPQNIIERFQKRKLIKGYEHSFDKANGLFVIGDMMAEEFTQKFGKIFHPMMNSIEFSNVAWPSFSHDDKKEISIVYAGGLSLNRWRMIIEFGKLMKKCCDALHKEINIEVYSVQQPEESILKQLSEKPICFKGSLSGDELSARLGTADYLLHVESTEPKYRQLTKLSVSTKIPEYLASGTCIIGFGPQEVASMRVLSDNKIGATITDLDTDDQKIEKLTKILSDGTMRKEFAERGFGYAYKYFNAENSRQYLKNVLHMRQ